MAAPSDLDRYDTALLRVKDAKDALRKAEEATAARRRDLEEAERDRDSLRERIQAALDAAEEPQDDHEAPAHEANGSAAASHRGRDTAPETLWALNVLLEDAKDVSSSELGNALGVTAEAAWQRLQRLVELGFAEKPRRGRYAITDEGRRKAQEAEN